MIWIIIAVIIAYLTIMLIKNTHVSEYYNNSWGGCKKLKEFKLILTVGHAILISVLALIPIVNIVLFLVFIIYYLVHCLWNPKENSGYTHVFSLHGPSHFIKILKGIKRFLNKQL